jgi:methyl-accepting chemotaxis protein
MPLNATAIQRGLSKKVEAMNQSLEKVQQKVKLATATLSQLTSK